MNSKDILWRIKLTRWLLDIIDSNWLPILRWQWRFSGRKEDFVSRFSLTLTGRSAFSNRTSKDRVNELPEIIVVSYFNIHSVTHRLLMWIYWSICEPDLAVYLTFEIIEMHFFIHTIRYRLDYGGSRLSTVTTCSGNQPCVRSLA